MKVKFSQLQLEDIQIENFSLEENLEGQNRFKIDIDFDPVIVETDNEKFDGLLVNVKINDRARNVKLKAKAEILAVFKFTEELNEEKKARLLLYNGLSIVYGFIRGIIFQKCSYLPLKDRIIPSVNIAQLIEETIQVKTTSN